MKREKIAGAVAGSRVIACLLGLALLPVLASCDAQKGEAAVERKGGPGVDTPVLVRLGKFERGEISNRLAVAADLEAVAKADVYPEIPGPVFEILHREGDLVKRNEPVVRLVDEHLRLRVEEKRILAAQAKTQVKLKDLAHKESAEVVAQKKLRLEKAQNEYDRVKKLSEDPADGVISIEEVETKFFELSQARLEHQASIFLSAKFEAEHALAAESEKLADVDLRTAEYNLSQATLRSPIDGHVSFLVVKRGELVSASTKVFTVVDTSKLEARLHVPQRELSRLRAGLSVRILCEVFPDREFQGAIEVVNPVVDKQNGTIQVIVGVTDPTNFLKPGMFVNGEIILDTRADAILVSKKAVSYEDREPIVFLVKGKTAHRYLLKPGYSNREHIEVLGIVGADGKPADPFDGRLVVIGHSNLKEGSKVEVE